MAENVEFPPKYKSAILKKYMGESRFSAPLKSGSVRNPFYKGPAARSNPPAPRTHDATEQKPTPETSEATEEDEAARRRRKAASLASLSLSVASLALMNAARHRQEEDAQQEAHYHAQNHRSQERTLTHREEPPSVTASGFERFSGTSVSNANVGYFESVVLGNSAHMPLQLVRMGSRQQGDTFVNGETSHYDRRGQSIVVNPEFFQRGSGRSSPDAFYGEIALREGAQVFDWDNAPNLSPARRQEYKNAFVQHVLRHTPRVTEHFRSPHAHLPWQQQVELRAKAYQRYLTQTILSLPLPDTHAGTWDEGIAQQLHTLHHLPIGNARFEVALFRYMIEITFPCRTPEVMHRDAQQALANISQRAGHRIQTTTLGQPSRHHRSHH